jgi:septal ring-binding cell division protein DamX
VLARRQQAIAAMEGRCPRCAAPRERRQAYCVECGLRLPPLTGALAGLRRRWLRRLGWYPGDWVWPTIPALAVAIAGAAAAIALGGTSSQPAAAPTIVALTPPRPTAAAAPASVHGPAPRRGLVRWPPSRDGWTVALLSYPVSGGAAAPVATADRASRGGLPQVGVLVSSEFSSLHPGYYIVFSGVYSSRDEAEAALPSVRATGFSSASTRQISR